MLATFLAHDPFHFDTTIGSVTANAKKIPNRHALYAVLCNIVVGTVCPPACSDFMSTFPSAQLLCYTTPSYTDI